MTNTTSLRAEAPSYVPGSVQGHAASEAPPSSSPLVDGVAPGPVQNKGEKTSARRRPRRRRNPKRKKQNNSQIKEGDCFREDGSQIQNTNQVFQNRRNNNRSDKQKREKAATNVQGQQRRTRHAQSRVTQRAGPRNGPYPRRGRRRQNPPGGRCLL